MQTDWKEGNSKDKSRSQRKESKGSWLTSQKLNLCNQSLYNYDMKNRRVINYVKEIN